MCWSQFTDQPGCAFLPRWSSLHNSLLSWSSQSQLTGAGIAAAPNWGKPSVGLISQKQAQRRNWAHGGSDFPSICLGQLSDAIQERKVVKTLQNSFIWERGTRQKRTSFPLPPFWPAALAHSGSHWDSEHILLVWAIRCANYKATVNEVITPLSLPLLLTSLTVPHASLTFVEGLQIPINHCQVSFCIKFYVRGVPAKMACKIISAHLVSMRWFSLMYSLSCTIMETGLLKSVVCASTLQYVSFAERNCLQGSSAI